MKACKLVLIYLSIMSFIACNNEDELTEHQECIDTFLEQFDMNAFNGDEVKCGKNYLVLFENETTSFAILHNDCVDLQPQLLIGCNGQELCTYLTEEGCFEMVMESQNLGIIGME